ncbi:Lrp/AsnC family transcriptional regulator [Heyndrickxia sp. NPDC080065]|uniref:Lrp/AsnC family transcriptional regulator n=1 Tax=Heyndrickxia sp. NPDC080065 TaxID=3390568 RepID=UPI003D08C2F8
MDENVIRILEIIEKNGRIPLDTLAKMVNMTEEKVAEIIKDLENRKIIASYISVINWSKINDQEMITALIDVKVTPKRGVGFDAVAERIYRYPQVKSVYLMSGAYDLSVVVEGKSMLEVASFVSDKLATIDSVISTATHFILKKYKHDGVIFGEGEKDRRIMIQP